MSGAGLQGEAKVHSLGVYALSQEAWTDPRGGWPATFDPQNILKVCRIITLPIRSGGPLFFRKPKDDKVCTVVLKWSVI